MSQQMQLEEGTAVGGGSESESREVRTVGMAREHVHAPARTRDAARALARVAVRRYDGFAQSLHWLVALLISVQLVLGALAWKLPRFQSTVLPLHKWVGVTLEILAIARLAWRVRHAPPSLPASMNIVERVAAKSVHAALQVLTLMLPLTGWVLLSGPGRALKVVGLFAPALLKSQSAIGQLKSVHGFLAASLVLIVLLHAAAALRHHFWLRDEILVGMLPRRRDRRAP